MIKPKTTLSIDGEFLFTFEEVTLNQSINEHHTFTIIVDYDSIEATGAYTLDNSKEWLGKPAVINFDDTEFLGIITNVKLQHDNGFDGKLVVSGYSKTILLENGTHMRSWLGKGLNAIIDDTVNAAGIAAQITPVFSTPIEYQAQYQENHFQFIQRMAKQYNEWLYYDGIQLVFGKPTLEAPISIEYGADMDTINIAIEAIASGGTNFSYNAMDDTRNESKTRGEVAGLNELASYAFETSKGLFSTDTKGYSSTRVKDKSEIDTIVKNKQGSKVATANVLSGTSSKQGLTVGSVIKVTAAQRGIGAFDVKNYGEYIITKITHEATGLSQYSNKFEAISSGVALLPEPEVTLPEAHPQLATVLSNDDPNQMGRVQVQFQWQTGAMKTSWVRVMTPDAGSSDHHAQNRGHVFIPEAGDQVMVGFRYNDPNRPFVMGSLFNGTTGAGGRDQNNYKSIITKSGHTIEFNDTDRSESITITDKSNNVIFIDTANKNIRISAPENISISSKNVDITASENLTISAGKNMGINAGDDMNIGTGDSLNIAANEDLMIMAKTITEHASENFQTLATNIEEHAESISKNSTKENIDLNSAGSVNNNTGDKVKLF
ncbi:type VI secretion system Vgr family protein [Aquimarina algiphila]|uniref:type VI secretion system Vgr family protein n=1 Tax=Aquimarina algiphila TaxID=2047982 RepID=UPI00232B8D9A|nr:phage baseplate assembly protein V [Aquimarina algiphila]